ncbi:MAG: DUF2087 domain-containing protein [Hyphomicrobiales bacterium]|nr:DUF2087 domain-containing protein [Hyphomicrobiales bacterium]
MSRTPLPFAVDDVSAFARALAGELADHPDRPGHVDLLNMLARAGGHRNWQHFRAATEAMARLERPAPRPVPVDTARLTRIVRYFDETGRLIRWPGKASHRPDCLWVMWSRLPARAVLHEREINARLAEEHRFGDHALLRRELVDGGWMTRTPDGREYRRLEKAPPPEAVALIRLLAARSSA